MKITLIRTLILLTVDRPGEEEEQGVQLVPVRSITIGARSAHTIASIACSAAHESGIGSSKRR